VINSLSYQGEIKCTGFNDQCDQFFHVFEEGKVYYISNARVGIAKKGSFNTINNEYEITLGKDSNVEPVGLIPLLARLFSKATV
jgi:replication factor A1